ncbi:pyrin-like [Micropterus dolomieu]|uniref:pyrin-like n=1 Tax=Micropterus dolomieu TaxID=147949 RepID=UPI001E8E0ADE|nr:pyrin-like [Micropterus dolomieu]
MLVPVLLLGTLEELLDDDLKMLKWYLSMHVSGSCAPIPRSHLDKASRTETVSKMIECYGEEDAVNITIEILKKMNFNDTAGKLENRYTEGKTATPTTSSTAVESRAAPFTMSAQQGGVIIAPTVTSTSGSLNITFNK